MAPPTAMSGELAEALTLSQFGWYINQMVWQLIPCLP